MVVGGHSSPPSDRVRARQTRALGLTHHRASVYRTPRAEYVGRVFQVVLKVTYVHTT